MFPQLSTTTTSISPDPQLLTDETTVVKEKFATLYLNNINGYTSKKTSLTNIISLLKPSILCLVETKVIKSKVYKLKNYDNVVKRNIKQGKGGMLIAIRNNTFTSVNETTASDNENIITAEILYSTTLVRIILCYGPQEESNTDIKYEFYQDLAIEVESAMLNNALPIILGDFNAKLKNDDNNRTIADSGNGKLLLDNIIAKYELKVCNFHENAEGRFTRIRKKKTKMEKSTLDYIITTDDVFQHVSKFIVDEDKLQTPFRVVKRKSKPYSIYSDHCSITISLPILHAKKKKRKEKKWVITKKGLEKFNELSTPPFFIVEGQLDVDANYEKFTHKMRETMGKCFKEKEISCDDEWEPSGNEIAASIKKLKRLRRKGKIQRIIANNYITKIKEIQAEQVSKQNLSKVKDIYLKLSDDGKFSSNEFWNLRRSLKKQNTEKSSIIVGGQTELFGEIAITNAYKEEFTYRLRNRKISPELMQYEKTTVEIVKNYLKYAETIKSQRNFTIEELQNIIRKLAKRKAPGIDQLTTELLQAAGDGLLMAILELFNYMKNEVVIPQHWEYVLITTIYKGKGRKKELVNHRGIFLISVLYKIFERLIHNRIQDILEKTSKFQAGATHNRGPADNLFLLRGTMDHLVYLNKPAYITLYDFRQAFDSLWLEDCMLSLWKVGLHNELLPLIYKLNKRAVVKVNTPHGRSDSFIAEDIVKQGAVLGSNICSTSTAEFCEYPIGSPVGNLLIRPLAFVDDIAVINITLDGVVTSHAMAVSFSKLKKLELNESKCYLLIVNGKGDESPKLFINEKEVSIQEAVKYLGDIINSKNDNSDMLKEKEKKAFGKLISIFATVDEITFGAFQLSALILMYHSFYLSSVIFNCQAWTNLSGKDISKLRTIQLRYLKKMLKVPQATPNSFVYLETGILPIDHEIYRRQCGFLHHILNLEEGDPVKLLYTHMRNLPDQQNWANTIYKTRLGYGIDVSDDEIKTMSLDEFKALAKRKIRDKVFRELLDDIKTKAKLSQLSYTKYEQQTYLTNTPPNLLYTIIKIRCNMLDTIKNRPYLFANLSTCRLCGMGDESLHHIMNCYLVSRVWVPVINDDIYSETPNNEYLFRIATTVNRFFEEIDRKDGINL